MHAWAGSIGMVMLACGPMTAPPMPPPEPTPTVVDEPAPARPPPAREPAPPVAAREPAPPVAAPEPSGSPLVIASECRGAKLDLKQLVATQACAVRSRPVPLPPSVAVTVEPVTVMTGRRVEAAVVLTNTTDHELVLVLDNGCDNLARVNYEMRDARGLRVDAGASVCAVDGGCIASQLGLAIAPKGTARVPFVFDPRTEEYDKACESRRVNPVPRGTYDVTIYWNWGLLKTTATVR